MSSVDHSAGARPHDCVHGRSANGCIDCKVRLFSVCGALEAAELYELDRISQLKDFPAKATLFEEGADARDLFNVTDGVVRLFKSLSDGRRQIVGFALPGDFLGLAMMDRYSVSAEAVTQLTVCRFARPVFGAFLECRPHLLRRLHEFAEHEISLAQEQMLLLGRRSAEEKLAAFLLSLRSRYGRIGALTVTVPLPMSRHDIADYLGLTVETVSRTFTKLAREKALVVIPDGVRLLNLKQLAQFVSP